MEDVDVLPAEFTRMRSASRVPIDSTLGSVRPRRRPRGRGRAFGAGFVPS
ncbi:hypothetical protein HMPREF0682_0154 [Propionibacterium acidifaciens F0233]|uniref:Uncharacterized protein n=1 Tax=Propionibacterium acidifaciens F0233 TaxID=553198 RepID=U2R2Q4_9ACTN|nr:hypothetical protein HMPREF0682_0154 [Propionibacterium acidifaciens F0233]